MGYTSPETKRRWREQNRDKVNAAQRASYARNRERRLAMQREYNERDAEKIKARRKAAYDANPQKYMDKSLKTRHGLTPDEYEAILQLQGGGCAICGASTPGGRSNRFHVDHDHSHCGKIRSCNECRRGLLCSKCNVGVGYFRDDPSLLARAIQYLGTA